MYLDTKEYLRYSKWQTMGSISFASACLLVGVLFVVLLHWSSAGQWLIGFGVGYVACRVVHAIAEQRWIARELRQATETLDADRRLRETSEGSVTIE